MPFSKEDSEHLMSLCETALERHATRVLEEASAVINNVNEEAGIRLFWLRSLLRDYKKREVEAFNPNRVGPIDRLTSLISLDLMSEADLDGFSPEVRAKAVRLGEVMRMRRDSDADEEVPPPRMLELRGREVEVRVVTGLPDELSEARGEAPRHVGLEVEYEGK